MSEQQDHSAGSDVADAPHTARSSWPTVIGVITLIYAIGGIAMWTCYSAFTVFLMEFLMGLNGMELEVPVPIKAMAAVIGLVSIALGVFALLGSVGLLRRRRAGVQRLRRWAVIRIALVFVGVVITVLTAPMQLEFQRRAQDAQNDFFRENDMEAAVVEQTDEELWTKTLRVNAVFTVVLVSYPVFIGFYLSRRRVFDEIRLWD